MVEAAGWGTILRFWDCFSMEGEISAIIAGCLANSRISCNGEHDTWEWRVIWLEGDF